VTDFLLEIGAENVPASYVEPAFRQLADDAETMFADLRLPWEEIYATGTPRRLVLLVRGLADRQETAEETVTGPPVSRGFGEDGTPTKAAEGFARSHGRSVPDLQRISTPKGEYLGFRRELESRRTRELLAERLPGLIGALRFPKVMKWETSGTRFARPVRWIVCLYGSAVVRFAFAGVDSGPWSYGRPWFDGERVRIGSAGSYLSDISRLGVMVDDEARRERIWTLAVRTAAKSGLVPKEDVGLLDELTFMLENPRVFIGEFSPDYLNLPPEVVTTAMRSHQRYIALEDGRGRLVAKFVAFTDGPVTGPREVRRGNEKVLRARLDDAQFYWQEDLKRGMDGLAAKLRRIVFIEGLGTLGQKSDRIRELARYTNAQLEGERRLSDELIDRASALAKADLASEMIKDGKEFTLLQGLIGSHYSRECGEDPAVVDAIDQHYRPRSPADAVPTSLPGAILGVADRMDTICGCFLAGFVPTGSQDPYALRRQANGLMRLLEREPSVRVDDLVRIAVDLYVDSGLADREPANQTISALDSFFETRCDAFLKDRGIAYDIVDAVSRVCWTRPGVALARAREIARYRGDAEFERLVTGVKRVGNILSADKRTYGSDWESILESFGHGSAKDGEPDSKRFATSRFADPAEIQLHQAITGALPQVAEYEHSGDFASVLKTLSRLADPIDEYFDRVLVNCEEPDLRENRHRFLAALFGLFSRYADFSCIVEEGPR
jgi:glycyl-tRNA synthetase beta chain